LEYLNIYLEQFKSGEQLALILCLRYCPQSGTDIKLRSILSQ